MKNQVMSTISLNTLLRECKKEDISDEVIKQELSAANGTNIHQIFGYRFYEDDLVDTLDVYHDGNYIIGYIIPSYQELLKKVWLFLLKEKVPKHIEDNEELTKRLTERLNLLKNLSLPIELCTEENAFYYIDDYYSKGIKYHNKIMELKRRNQKNSKEFKAIKHFYYSKAFYPNYEDYIKQVQSLFFERLITKRKEYKELIETKTFNSIINKYFDLNKVAMYIVHTYLVKCEESTNHEIIAKYYKLIEKYKDSNSYNKEVSLTTDEGIQLNWENLQRRINYIEQKLQDYEVEVNWEIVPSSKKKVLKQQGQPRSLVLTKEQAKKLAELQQIGNDKKEFYESTPYMLKARGLKKYRGYVAYIYENGRVLLDREYDEKAPSSAKGNAIFAIKAIDFGALSRLDKTTLRKNPKVQPIDHRSYWKDRVNELIYTEGKEEDKEASITLVKKLRKEC